MKRGFHPAQGVLIDGEKRGVMNNRGVMTIEASVIVPVVLFGVFICLFGLMLIYEKGYVQSCEYVALYTIPFNDIRNGSVEEYLSGQNYTGGVVLGEANVETNYNWHKAKCQGVISLKGDSEVKAAREIDVLVERLRRWQFYDDIKKDQGYE